MDPNCPGRFPIVEMAQHGVPHHVFQIIPVVALGEYAVSDGAGFVAAFGGLPNLEDYFRFRHPAFHLRTTIPL